MKKTVALGVTLAVAVITAIGFMPSASAAALCQVYPAPATTLDASLTRDVLYSGETFTGTAGASAAVDIVLEWNGVSASKDNTTTLSKVFTAPEVEVKTVIDLHATFSCDDAGQGTVVPFGKVIGEKSIPVTVLPRTTGPNGADLPNTGGPNLLFLVVGLGLLVTGTGAVVIARRRAGHGDLTA